MLATRVLVLLAAVSTVFLLGAWGWQAQVQALQDEERDKRGERDVTLRIAGDPQARFSGVCLIRAHEQKIGGGVPRRYAYDLDNRRLVCEIRKQGAESGELKVVLNGEGTHSVYRMAGKESVVRLIYDDGNLSSSMSSSGGGMSSSSSQVSSSSFSQTLNSSSSISSASDATRGREKRESLADRIVDDTWKRIEDAFERVEP
jgi:hypothetical protein